MKTEIEALTNRMNRDIKPTPFGELIDCPRQGKYLRVNSDETLDWNTHISKVIEKARISL